MRSFNQGKNDAYGQARLNAIQTAPQTLQMATALRNQPLNELNSLRTGAQVTNPTFTDYAKQGTTQGADMLGATTAGYNAQLGATNANNAFANGLLGAAGSVGSGWAKGGFQ